MKPSMDKQNLLNKKDWLWAYKMELQHDSVFLFVKNDVVMMRVDQLWKSKNMATYADVE